jgi:hypothetical protein
MQLKRLFGAASVVGLLAVCVPALVVPAPVEAAVRPGRPSTNKKPGARRSTKKPGHRKATHAKRRAQ